MDRRHGDLRPPTPWDTTEKGVYVDHPRRQKERSPAPPGPDTSAVSKT